ncbi:MAG: YidC/Oxa1 family membrane protein insertase [Verrucomicrobiales bacterium]
MTEIRESWLKDDPQKQNTEVMKLYGEYGVNPLGGCLPMFAQLPVFLAFYRMLSSAVELRHEGFLWVKDLSMPDTVWTIPGLDMPLNLLPLLMAGTTYVQMSLTPKTGDKTQQMVMMFMPAMFVFICYNFASALALYWTTSNLFSILQIWVDKPAARTRIEKRKVSARGWRRFFDRLRECAKQQQERARTLGDRGDRHTQSKTKSARNRQEGWCGEPSEAPSFILADF